MPLSEVALSVVAGLRSGAKRRSRVTVGWKHVEKAVACVRPKRTVLSAADADPGALSTDTPLRIPSRTSTAKVRRKALVDFVLGT